MSETMPSRPAMPAARLTSPDVWSGRDLAGLADWRYAFTPADIDELIAAVRRAADRPWRAWRREDVPLPTLGPRIAEWVRELDAGRGFVLLRGFPVGDHPEDVCAGAYWALGLHMGRAISQNTDGDLLGRIEDTGADPKAYGVRLYKTRAEQDFHTDAADMIGLFCLQAAKSGGVSRIVSSPAIFNRILAERPDLVPVLFEPFPFDTQGQHKPGEKAWFEIPLCRWDGRRLRTFFVPWYIRESQQHAACPRLSRAQVEAIEFIERAANDPDAYLDMNFRPGDMQFLKNAAVLHKRTEYEDWPEPERKRRLLRLWLVDPNFSAGDERLRRGVAAG
ncbi:MAG: TauD/TfdA family dioxygenase [Phenylobacterium sp.]|uniref:TauD/TfdA family dioxygenase n=1 Tax=Phenylobacterium sp. TaxID=1871053 RepID=UPI001A409900|nr:TauD/TfdA family dioxygenase [Phenylobacterium sp.]MBL8770878.1 TauD/TfdA family dioxygenase [Phenylobacterium sp.]